MADEVRPTTGDAPAEEGLKDDDIDVIITSIPLTALPNPPSDNTREYEFYHRRLKKWSRNIKIKRWIRVAKRRSIIGRGPWTVVAGDGEVIVKDATRRRAIRALRHAALNRPFDTQLRLRNPNRVVFLGRPVKPKPDVRGLMQYWMRWSVQSEPGIHYSQNRPYPSYAPGKLPEWLDCSSGAITICRWGGAHDPSGFGFDGYGNTQSIAAGPFKEIPYWQMQPGDIATFGDVHTSICYMKASDPVMWSHGWEGAPQFVRLSVERSWHSSSTLRCWRLEY
jgi:hypothetical protein